MKVKRTPARVTLVGRSFTTLEVATLRLEWSLGAMDVLRLDIPEFMPELHNTCPGSQPILPQAPLVLLHNEEHLVGANLIIIRNNTQQSILVKLNCNVHSEN